MYQDIPLMRALCATEHCIWHCSRCHNYPAWLREAMAFKGKHAPVRYALCSISVFRASTPYATQKTAFWLCNGTSCDLSDGRQQATAQIWMVYLRLRLQYSVTPLNDRRQNSRSSSNHYSIIHPGLLQVRHLLNPQTHSPTAPTCISAKYLRS